MSRTKLLKQGFKPLNEHIWKQIDNSTSEYETLYDVSGEESEGFDKAQNLSEYLDGYNKKAPIFGSNENVWDLIHMKSLFTNADLRSFHGCGERIYGVDKEVYEEISSCNNLGLVPEELNTEPIACMPFPSYMIWLHEPISLLGNLHIFQYPYTVNGEKPHIVRKFNGFIVTYVAPCRMTQYEEELGIDFGPKNFKHDSSIYLPKTDSLMENGNLFPLNHVNDHTIFTKLAKEKLKYSTSVKNKKKNQLEGYLSISFISNDDVIIEMSNKTLPQYNIQDHLLVPIVKGIPFDQLASIALETHIREEKLKCQNLKVPEDTWKRMKKSIISRSEDHPGHNSVIEVFEQDWMKEDCYLYTKALNIVIGAIAQLSHFPNYVNKKSKAIENINTGSSKKSKKQKTVIHTLTSTVPSNPLTTKRNFLKGITSFKVKPHYRKSCYRRQPHGDKWRKENPGEPEFSFPDGRTYHLIRLPLVKVNGPK